MSQPRNPNTAALEALVEAHARELHLPAIRSRFRQLAAEATREQQTPLAYLAALLEAEVQERAERRERRRLIDARFPLIKRLQDFRFQDNPKVPQATLAALAEGSWIDDRESIILIGESGSGKTMLATALGCSPPSYQHNGQKNVTTVDNVSNYIDREGSAPRLMARSEDLAR
jgi:DNA replication protein DnaC